MYILKNTQRSHLGFKDRIKKTDVNANNAEDVESNKAI